MRCSSCSVGEVFLAHWTDRTLPLCSASLQLLTGPDCCVQSASTSPALNARRPQGFRVVSCLPRSKQLAAYAVSSLHWRSGRGSHLLHTSPVYFVPGTTFPIIFPISFQKAADIRFQTNNKQSSYVVGVIQVTSRHHAVVEAAENSYSFYHLCCLVDLRCRVASVMCLC